MRDSLGDKVRLQHILDAIATIKEYVQNVNQDQFFKNSMIQDACIRQLQIIGEASNKISKELQESHDTVPWREIIGLRIIVIHKYFGIDENVIWDVIQNDLIPLEDLVKEIIEGID